MIQVDVFWAYAFGAMFASVACRQIRAEEGKWWESKYFMICVFYCGVFFAPSGAYLLWRMPQWESMQVFTSHLDLYNNPFLVVFFSVTNVTQGIVGYYVTYRFVKQGKYYAAYLQILLGYFCMFFILVHGWDGTGWQRFTYDMTLNEDTLWTPGATNGLAFFGGEVAITLYTMGVLILPPLFYWLNKWVKEGADLDNSVSTEKVDNFLKNSILMLILVFGLGLGGAILASIPCWLITTLTGGTAITGGWSIIGLLIGLPLFIGPVYYFLMRKDQPIYKFFKLLFIEEPGK